MRRERTGEIGEMPVKVSKNQPMLQSTKKINTTQRAWCPKIYRMADRRRKKKNMPFPLANIILIEIVGRAMSDGRDDETEAQLIKEAKRHVADEQINEVKKFYTHFNKHILQLV